VITSYTRAVTSASFQTQFLSDFKKPYLLWP